LYDFPGFETICEGIKPEVTFLKGWKENISLHSSYDQVPEAFKKYIDYLEENFSLPVSVISLGPGRLQTIIRKNIEAI